MRCPVCNQSMTFYFRKDFYVLDLQQIEYWRCGGCGFTAARTLYELPEEAWNKLNEAFHSQYHFTNECPFDMNWVARLSLQAETIAKMKNAGIIPTQKPWLDYGCGDGKLSDLLSQYHLTLLNFDEYGGPHTTRFVSKEKLIPGSFDMVISTSVFEHVRDLRFLEKMEGLVNQEGCLAIHTLVREEIPRDPEWFYLLPVHCSLFTNASMKILFDKWRYHFSLYHVPSRLWFWYRKSKEAAARIKKTIERLNQENGKTEFYFKQGFMDYWKCAKQWE